MHYWTEPFWTKCIKSTTKRLCGLSGGGSTVHRLAFDLGLHRLAAAADGCGCGDFIRGVGVQICQNIASSSRSKRQVHFWRKCIFLKEVDFLEKVCLFGGSFWFGFWRKCRSILLRPSSVAAAVVCLSVTLCIVAKRCVLEQKLYWQHIGKSYMRNRLVPKWMTLTFV